MDIPISTDKVLSATFTVMVGSLVATASNMVLEMSGGYTVTFIMLLALTFVALLLNLFIRKP